MEWNVIGQIAGGAVASSKHLKTRVRLLSRAPDRDWVRGYALLSHTLAFFTTAAHPST